LKRIFGAFFIITIVILTSCDKEENESPIDITLLSSDGKDAIVSSTDPTGEYDRGTNRRDIVISEWTINGIPTTSYGLLDFDFSAIPEGAKITEAKLSLYHDPNSPEGGHSQLSGSNAAYIQRITSNWIESVSWNDQPLSTEVHQVSIAASESEIQDYIDIDVTELTQDIINNRANSFGFMIKLISTQYYRKLVFASGENPDSNLYPKLEIQYSNY